MAAKRGLYANINAKKKAGKKPRKKGAKGAPTDQDFRNAAKTAKKKPKISAELRRSSADIVTAASELIGMSKLDNSIIELVIHTLMILKPKAK